MRRVRVPFFSVGTMVHLSPPQRMTATKSAQSAVGAPSQFKQASRKGKKSWRKNVNIEDVETALEGMRTEERETGTTLQKTQDSDLFQVDVKGDDRSMTVLMGSSIQKLTSYAHIVLSQRSAVPAVFSRTTSAKRKSGLTNEEKDRLLRIAKRPRKGPFNSIMDPSEYKSGSSVVELSEAVKKSGTYDPWQPEKEESLPYGTEALKKKKPKVPKLPHPKQGIEVPAVVEPHQGTSYNPPVDAHHELLLTAHEKEEKRLKEEQRLAEIKQKISKLSQDEDEDMNVAPGMKLDEVEEEEEEEKEDKEEQTSVIPPKKAPERKTKQQRRKAAEHLALQRALADKAAKKRLAASLGDALALRKATLKTMKAREEEKAQRQLAMKYRMRRRGLAGQRLGKHTIPEGDVEVQLGEDLSESLRAMKPEGNLFRDRFLSLQQRALIEPRVPVLPKRRRAKIVEYEKHPWKRFQ